MKVYWTDTAEGHLDAIYDYIAQDSPEYAKRGLIASPADHSRLLSSHYQAAESLNMILIRFAK